MRLVLIVALAGCIAVASVSATERVVLSGRIVALADGDTLTLLTADRKQYRIRLDGIDAPERTQPYSQLSRKNLFAMVNGQQVTVTSSKTDRFGRIVGIVRTDQHPDVGLEQIKAGLAWHFKRYEDEQTPENRASYAAAEAIAKAARHGLWLDPEPVSPWDFRASKALQSLLSRSDQCVFGSSTETIDLKPGVASLQDCTRTARLPRCITRTATLRANASRKSSAAFADRARHFFNSVLRIVPHVANKGGASLFLGSSPGDQIITLHFEQAMNSVS